MNERKGGRRDRRVGVGTEGWAEGQKGRRRDRRAGGGTDGQAEGQTGRRWHRRRNEHERMNKQTRTNKRKRTNEATNEQRGGKWRDERSKRTTNRQKKEERKNRPKRELFYECSCVNVLMLGKLVGHNKRTHILTVSLT